MTVKGAAGGLTATESEVVLVSEPIVKSILSFDQLTFRVKSIHRLLG